MLQDFVDLEYETSKILTKRGTANKKIKTISAYIDRKEESRNVEMKLPDAILLDTKLNHVETTSVCSQ